MRYEILIFYFTHKHKNSTSSKTIKIDPIVYSILSNNKIVK